MMLIATLIFILSACAVPQTYSSSPTEDSSPNTTLSDQPTEMITPENTIQSPNIGSLIIVPAGSFQRDENPENISNVASFLMAQTEVTRAQFTKIAELDDPSLPEYSHGKNDPVQSVTWYETLIFCNRLSEKENLTPVYSIDNSTDPDDWGNAPTSDDEAWNDVTADWTANGYRLPTEMEWMWAAMGADLKNHGEINTTGYTKRFSGDTGENNIDDYAWHGEGREGISRPVGQKLPNELGIYDLTGNVWEWVWDRLGEYPSGELNQYTGIENGDERVLRGGSWLNPLERQTLVFRYHHTGDYKWHNMGFRVVRNYAS